MQVRYPSHAGSFYAGNEEALTKQIEECFLHKFGPGNLPKIIANGKRSLIALIAPHAGYMFSGSIAANGYYYAANDGKPTSIVIIGPNHTGFGSTVAIMTSGIWKMPFGDLTIDSDLATEIQCSSNFIDIDETAHRLEHSIEVQLPFLQYIYKSFKFVPISMMLQDLEVSKDIGEAIAKASSDRNILIIASTDLSHYVTKALANKQDQLVIEEILRLDEEGLQSKVESDRISMCGYGPVCVAITAAKKLGANKVHLLSYKTSGDIIGEEKQVVGYTSMAIDKSER